MADQKVNCKLLTLSHVLHKWHQPLDEKCYWRQGIKFCTDKTRNWKFFRTHLEPPPIPTASSSEATSELRITQQIPKQNTSTPLLCVLRRRCSHLHVVTLLPLHFGIDAKLLSGTQHTDLWSVQREHTALMLKIKQERRTQLYLPRLGIRFCKSKRFRPK